MNSGWYGAEVPVFGRGLYLHSEIVGCLLILLGVQAIGLGLCARAFGVYFISEHDRLFQKLGARFRLEHGLLLAATVAIAGLALFGVVAGKWAAHGFGSLGEVRIAILAATNRLTNPRAGRRAGQQVLIRASFPKSR